jgi:hypothetical protein
MEGRMNDNRDGENSAGWEHTGGTPVGAGGTGQGVPEEDENLNAGPSHHVAPGILGGGGPVSSDDEPVDTGATEAPAGEDVRNP